MTRTKGIIKDFQKNLIKRFDIKDFGKITDYLGIEIDRNYKKGIFKISLKNISKAFSNVTNSTIAILSLYLFQKVYALIFSTRISSLSHRNLITSLVLKIVLSACKAHALISHFRFQYSVDSLHGLLALNIRLSIAFYVTLMDQ
jgi:hypothetical protein